MTTNNNLDALPQDAELPFSHPVRRSVPSRSPRSTR